MTRLDETGLNDEFTSVKVRRVLRFFRVRTWHGLGLIQLGSGLIQLGLGLIELGLGLIRLGLGLHLVSLRASLSHRASQC